MFRWLTSWLRAEDRAPRGFTRGDRVRKIDDELIGTFSGTVARAGIEHARVVYCGARATWVELIDTGLLRPA
jgi:hypothetical protein